MKPRNKIKTFPNMPKVSIIVWSISFLCCIISAPSFSQDFESAYEIPAWMVAGSGGGGVTDLDDLSDVTILSPAHGDILTYNGTPAVFENTTPKPEPTLREGDGITLTNNGYNDWTIESTTSATTLANMDDTDITTPANNDILVFNYSTGLWENATPVPTSVSNNTPTPQSLSSLTDVYVTGMATGHRLVWDGVDGRWENATPLATVTPQPTPTPKPNATPQPTPTHDAFDNLNNFNATGKVTGSIPFWNGSIWSTTTTVPSGGGVIVSLDDLTDVSLGTPANLDHLVFDSGTGYWKNASPVPTATAVNTTTPRPTVTPIPTATKESLSGLTDTTISSPLDGQILVYDQAAGKWENATQIPTRAPSTPQPTPTIPSLSSLSDTTISGLANGDHLVYNSGVSRWKNATQVPVPTAREISVDGDEAAGDLNFLVDGNGTIGQNLGDITITIFTPVPTATIRPTVTPRPTDTPIPAPTLPSLSSLTDTTISTPLDNQYLRYDSGTGKWVNETVTSTDDDGIATSGGYDVTTYSVKFADGDDIIFDGSLGEIRADNQLQIILDNDDDDTDWGFDMREEDGTYDYIAWQWTPGQLNAFVPFRYYNVSGGGTRGWATSNNMSTNTKTFECNGGVISIYSTESGNHDIVQSGPSDTIFSVDDGNEIGRFSSTQEGLYLKKNLIIPIATPSVDPPSGYIALHALYSGSNYYLLMRDENGDDYYPDGGGAYP